MNRLDELLQVAIERSLTDIEIDELTRLSILSKRIEGSISKLFSGGQFGALNLRKLSILRRANNDHLKNKPPHKNIRGRKDGIKIPEEYGHVNLFLTDHAIERYIQRINNCSRDDAVIILLKSFLDAKKLDEKTLKGEEQWLAQIGFVYVVKYDFGFGKKKNKRVCVTILVNRDEINAPEFD